MLIYIHPYSTGDLHVNEKFRPILRELSSKSMHIAVLAKIILFLEVAQILLLFLNQSFSLFNFIFLIDSFRIENNNNKLGFNNTI